MKQITRTSFLVLSIILLTITGLSNAETIINGRDSERGGKLFNKIFNKLNNKTEPEVVPSVCKQQ